MRPDQQVVLDIIALRSAEGDMGRSLLGAETEEGVLTIRHTFRPYDEETGKWVDAPEGVFQTFLGCSDTFFWGSADCEEVTVETWPILLATLNDVRPLWSAANARDTEALMASPAKAKAEYEAAHPDREDREWWAEDGQRAQPHAPQSDLFTADRLVATFADLYAARVREMRPQGACYSRYPEEAWPLFHAAGPEREVGHGNPYRPGEYRR